MTRPLLVLLCTTIVAAFQVPLAAVVAVSEDVPVPGGTETLAHTFGLDAVPDRGRFTAQITRLASDIAEGKNPSLDAWLQQMRAAARGTAVAPPAAPPDLVPVPLTAAVWSEAVFHRQVLADALFGAIVSDRAAALVCHGLTALDDETLTFLSDHPAIVTALYERDAAVFAAFSSGLHVHQNRVVPPGGESAAALWEAVVGEKVTRPERFIAELFSRADGRTAYLYDAIAALDAPHAAFALGLSIRDEGARIERFKTLSHVANGAFREWHLKTMPFSRTIFDLATLLDRVRVDASGAPLRPAARAVWAAAFDNAPLGTDAGREIERGHSAPIDAAWLAEAVGGDLHQRAERLDQLSFGQRVFASGDDAAAVVAVLRAFPRDRMLLLTLERLGVTDPRVYLAATERAARLAQFDHYRGFVTLAQFQGALALIVRMRAVRAIDPPKAEALVTSLVAVPLGSDGYAGAMTRWIANVFPAGDGDVEDAILARIAGVRADAPLRKGPSIDWEGQQYHLDLASAEEKRLRKVRERQGGPTVDVAVKLEETVAMLNGASPDVAAALIAIKKLTPAIPARSKLESSDVAPPGVQVPKNIGETVQRVVDELTKIQTKDTKKAGPAAEPLRAIADGVLAEALLSIAYAVELGDPDGSALLVGNVARRHDFGFGLLDGDLRARAAWSLPRQDFAPGVPWHVTGSALGLDVALSSLALRRVDTSHITDAPRLTSNERQTFTTSVALLNPFALTDADRDAIVAAIGRGQHRLADLRADPRLLDAFARDIALDGRRRRVVQWALGHDAASVESMFSLTELLYLGGPPEAALDAWGMAELPISGCLCTTMSRPGRWARLVGRPQLGLLATTVADLNLHVALALHELRLPAAIARHVIGAAMQDFIDEVKPVDADDWLALVRGARSITRERIEDYVAAVAADGPLVPDEGPRAPKR